MQKHLRTLRAIFYDLQFWFFGSAVKQFGGLLVVVGWWDHGTIAGWTIGGTMGPLVGPLVGPWDHWWDHGTTGWTNNADQQRGQE